MKNVLKIDMVNSAIVMDRTFARKCVIVGSAEYEKLQVARQNYPTYRVMRREIKKNPSKECYRGLTYAYMEKYISTHSIGTEIMNKYNELRLRTECHSVRYPHIKKWFLEQFPEVNEFTISEDIEKEAKQINKNYLAA